MPLSFQCPCGRLVQVEPKQLGSAVRCPGCGRGLLLPALGRLEPPSPRTRSPRLGPPSAPGAPRRWRRLGPVAAVALLALAGLGLALFRSIPRPSEAGPSTPPAHAAVEPAAERVVARPASPADTPPARAKETAEYRQQPPTTVRAQLPAPSPGPLRAEGPPPQPPPAPEPERPQERGRLTQVREGDRLYQEVVVGRVSACQAPGLDFRDQSRFAFLSSLEVDRVTAEGAVMTQKVEAVRLDQAEAGAREALGDLLRKAKGTSFRLILSPEGEVVRLEGAPSGVGMWSSREPGGLALSLQSTLDADAWKEVAQLTFFRPRGSPGNGGRWSRELTHDWGSLGRWTGQVTYQPNGKALGLDRYDYVLNVAYRPPAGGASSLPFAVGKADFRLVAGGGTIAYDGSRGRVAAADERFQVRGLLEATALGVTTPVGLEEVQVFQLRLLDKMPEAGSWSSPPP